MELNTPPETHERPITPANETAHKQQGHRSDLPCAQGQASCPPRTGRGSPGGASAALGIMGQPWLMTMTPLSRGPSDSLLNDSPLLRQFQAPSSATAPGMDTSPHGWHRPSLPTLGQLLFQGAWLKMGSFPTPNSGGLNGRATGEPTVRLTAEFPNPRRVRHYCTWLRAFISVQQGALQSHLCRIPGH